jgi:flagellar biosynthesis protein FlhA
MRLTDRADLDPGSYAIRLLGVEHGSAVLRPGQLLVLKGEAGSDLPPGDDVEEPVYGAPARWIDPTAREDAALNGLTIVTPSEVLATHLLEVLKRNLDRLLTFKTLQRQLDAFVTLSDTARAEENRRLLDEMVPDKVPLDMLHAVLRLLLSEQVSIRNLPLILEAIAEVTRHRQPARDYL